MKKICSFLLAISACFAFAACGGKKDSTTKTTTTEATTTQGGGGEQDGTVTTPNYEKVAEALGNKFYFDATIPYVDEDSGELFDVRAELAVDKSGTIDKIAMLSPVGGTYFIEKNDTEYLVYDLDVERNLYNRLNVELKEDMDEDISENIKAELKIACGLTIQYKTKENATYLDRACTHYQNTYTENNVEINEEWMIDNTIGICLNHTKASSEGFIDDKTTFVVNDFSLSEKVDSCFATQNSSIYVKFWDTEFFNAHGLNDNTSEQAYVDIEDIKSSWNSLYPGHLPTIKEVYAYSGYSTGENIGVKASHTTCYKIEGENADKEGFVNAVWVNLFTCGAKYDATGTERRWSDFTVGTNINSYTNQAAQWNFNLKYDSNNSTLTISLSDDSYIPQGQRAFKQQTLQEILDNMDKGYKIDVLLPYNQSQSYTNIPASIAFYGGSIIMSDPTGKQYFKRNSATDLYEWYIYDNGYILTDDELNKEYVEEESKIYERLSIARKVRFDYTAKESTSFLDRSCTKFINSIPGGETTEWIIDNSTGICLKCSKISSSQEQIIDDETFTVTGFALNTSATEGPVTDFFADEDAKIV